MTMPPQARQQLRARFEEIRQTLETRVATARSSGRDLTAAETAECEALGIEARQLRQDLTAAAEMDQTNQAIQRVASEIGVGREPGDQLPPLMPDADQVAPMFEAVMSRSGHPQTFQNRAAVSLTNAAGTPSIPIGVRPPGEPRRLAVAAGIPVVNGTGMAGHTFPLFGDADAADITAEGVAKPEYDNVTMGSATPAVIAIWSSWTRQTSETVSTYTTRLRAKLAARVARREDVLMVARVLGTAGINTVAATAGQSPSDAILAAIGAVMDSDVATVPNLVVINPADLVGVFGGSASRGPAGENPRTDLVLSVHGVNAYVTSAITAGQALVGAWSAGSEVVMGMPPEWLVDPFTMMTTNVIRARLEEALNLAVTEPAAFTHITDLTA